MHTHVRAHSRGLHAHACALTTHEASLAGISQGQACNTEDLLTNFPLCWFRFLLKLAEGGVVGRLGRHDAEGRSTGSSLPFSNFCPAVDGQGSMTTFLCGARGAVEF